MGLSDMFKSVMGGQSTSLLAAVKSGNYSEVCVVVQQQPTLVDQPDVKLRRTPLHHACFNGFDAIARELVRRGAQVDARDKEGRTPMHLASIQGHVKVVDDLIRAHSHAFNVRDQEGKTPLDYAMNHSPAIVALLQPYASVAPPVPNIHVPDPYPVPAPPPAAVQGPGPSVQPSPTPFYPVHTNPTLLSSVQPSATPLYPFPSNPTLLSSNNSRPSPTITPRHSACPSTPSSTPAGADSHADLDWGPRPSGDWGDDEPSSRESSRVNQRSASIKEVPGPPVASTPFQILGSLASGALQVVMSFTAHQSQAEERALAQLNYLRQLPRPLQPQGSDPGSPASTSSTGSNHNGRVYTYKELGAATGNFSSANIIGSGGYGCVYRGSLEGTPVAVKCMNVGPDAMQGQREFFAEVEILSRVRHPHIVMLIGSCPDRGILVYELLEGGTLEMYLQSGTGPEAGRQRGSVSGSGRGCTGSGGGRGAGHSGPLKWADRVRISAEIASALLFLHRATPSIVHMDLKPANILLDRGLSAKLGDVGLSRLMEAARKEISNPSTVFDSRVVGTIDYIDPEYLRTGHFSPRSDVYALGIIMLQLLTGRDPKSSLNAFGEVNPNGPPDTALVTQLVDKSAGNWPAAEAVAFAHIALACTSIQRANRPDLATVVQPTLAHLAARTSLYDPAAAPPTAAAATLNASPSMLLGAAGAAAEKLPPWCICPITQDIMVDPVCADDGHTYERAAITAWFLKNKRSPLTNQELPSTNVIPNYALRHAIQAWAAAHGMVAQ